MNMPSGVELPPQTTPPMVEFGRTLEAHDLVGAVDEVT